MFAKVIKVHRSVQPVRLLLAVALLGSLAVAAMNAQTTGMPFTATFDAGNFNEWMGFRNMNNATLPDTGCVSGRCLRIPFVPGTLNETYGDYYFADHQTVGGSRIEEVWVRLYSKFDTGTTWPGYDQKILVLNLTDAGGARRWQVIVNVTAGTYLVQHTDIDNWRFYNLDQNVGTPSPVRMGQWDKLKLQVRLNTPGQANGQVRLWVNDQLKTQRTDVNIRAGTSLGINKMIVGSYSNPPHNGTGVQWIDEVRLAATDPDAGGGATPPSPPTGVRIVAP
jgi:hypothetical protein